MYVFIMAPNARGYLHIIHIIFLTSPRKRMLWVLIRSWMKKKNEKQNNNKNKQTNKKHHYRAIYILAWL